MDDVDKIIDWLERRLIKSRKGMIRSGDDYNAGRESEVRNILHAVKQGHWKTEEQEDE